VVTLPLPLSSSMQEADNKVLGMDFNGLFY